MRHPFVEEFAPMAGDTGLVLSCAGCCCGHPESGGPKTPPRALKAATRRAFRRSGLDGRVRLAVTDCLGPCGEANVVFLYLRGRPLWFRRMNSPELIAVLVDYVRAAVDASDAALPATLAERSFTWTGGGIGPEPPVADAEPAAH
jgi:(2Fe-2S) ferredoxin